jgi:2'-5' RNA ligase
MIGQRLFVGVPVAPAVASELAGTCASLARRAAAQGVPLRWVPPESYHVTLRFLGWTREETVPAVAEAVRRAVAGVAPLRFRTRRLGAFEHPARATVVWAGVEDTGGSLATLAAALEREVVPLGFAAERRGFHAHVTLARLRAPASVENVLLPFAEQVFSETRCDFVTLFESLTKPTGSEYRPVLRATLSTANRQSEPVKTASLDASSGSDDGWDKR